MDAKNFGCLAEMIPVPVKCSLNVDPLELLKRLVEQYLPIEHFIYQRLETRAHLHFNTSRCRKISFSELELFAG